MSPLGTNAITDGWSRLPYSSGMTSTRLSRSVATTELVVPRSMPITCSTPLVLSVFFAWLGVGRDCGQLDAASLARLHRAVGTGQVPIIRLDHRETGPEPGLEDLE